MLEKVNFDYTHLDKNNYKLKYKPLIEELVVLQQQARSNNIGVVVLFEGWNGSGKGSRISDLMFNQEK